MLCICCRLEKKLRSLFLCTGTCMLCHKYTKDKKLRFKLVRGVCDMDIDLFTALQLFINLPQMSTLGAFTLLTSRF